jgi:myotubularin-related protein 1/2
VQHFDRDGDNHLSPHEAAEAAAQLAGPTAEVRDRQAELAALGPRVPFLAFLLFVGGVRRAVAELGAMEDEDGAGAAAAAAASGTAAAAGAGAGAAGPASAARAAAAGGGGGASDAAAAERRFAEQVRSQQRLPGEVPVTDHANCTRQDVPNSPHGTFLLTNHRIIFRDFRASAVAPYSSMEIALGCVSQVRRDPKSEITIIVTCKDGRVGRFSFDANAMWVGGLVDLISQFAFPGDQTKTFAFEYHPGYRREQDGWALYDHMAELERVGLANNPLFRVTRANEKYELCESYPRLFAVPANVTDEELAEVAEHRSGRRLPATVWLHPRTGAALTRCSQPLTGLKGRRSDQDERLFRVLREANEANPGVLYIIDARPYAAAMGNAVMGKGFESEQHYEKCQLRFMNVDNIHAIRNSFEQVVALCALDSAVYDDSVWLSRLEATSWLRYVRLLLESAVFISSCLDSEGASVVTHCSDGWDRTSQFSALAQLMLDPYFRTIKGFAVLIEKEFLSFGHKFAQRCGHASPKFDDDQRSPIFFHFLDAVWQLMRQFPLAFEFNEAFLLSLLDHVFSCRYGTFLFNNEKERVACNLRSRTPSLWTYFLSDDNVWRYVNPLYTPDESRLVPDVTARRIVLWEGFFFRHHTVATDAFRDNPTLYTLDILLRYRFLRQLALEHNLDLGEIEDWDRESREESITSGMRVRRSIVESNAIALSLARRFSGKKSVLQSSFPVIDRNLRPPPRNIQRVPAAMRTGPAPPAAGPAAPASAAADAAAANAAPQQEGKHAAPAAAKPKLPPPLPSDSQEQIVRGSIFMQPLSLKAAASPVSQPLPQTGVAESDDDDDDDDEI